MDTKPTRLWKELCKDFNPKYAMMRMCDHMQALEARIADLENMNVGPQSDMAKTIMATERAALDDAIEPPKERKKPGPKPKTKQFETVFSQPLPEVE